MPQTYWNQTRTVLRSCSQHPYEPSSTEHLQPPNGYTKSQGRSKHTHTQYAAPLDINPVALQQQLSKMKEDIKHLQQMKRPNVYPTPPGHYRSFQTADGLEICRRCIQVGHFARTCSGNLPPPRAPTHYQNHRRNYVSPSPSQHPQPLYTPNRPSNQYSQHPSYRSHVNQHDPIGYHYPQDATYTNPSRRP